MSKRHVNNNFMNTIKDIITRNVTVKSEELLAQKARILFAEYMAGLQKDPKERAKFLVNRDSVKATIGQLEEELDHVKNFLATLD